MPVSLASVTEWPLRGKAVKRREVGGLDVLDLCSGVGLKDVGMARLWEAEKEEESRRAAAAQVEEAGSGAGGEEVQQGAPP